MLPHIGSATYRSTSASSRESQSKSVRLGLNAALYWPKVSLSSSVLTCRRPRSRASAWATPVPTLPSRPGSPAVPDSTMPDSSRLSSMTYARVRKDPIE